MTETQLTEGTWLTPAEWRKTKGIKQKSRKKKKTDGHGKSYGKRFLSGSLTAFSSSSPGAKSSTHTAKRGRREEDRTRSAKTVPVPPTGPATSASGTPAATEEKCGTDPLFSHAGHCVGEVPGKAAVREGSDGAQREDW